MKVLVIGDSCQDVFVYGDIERISPEAPVPVFVPTHTENNDGMARNVSNNVEVLEMFITTITNKNGVFPDHSKHGIVKKRYVDNRSGQMVLRVDEHDYCDRIEKELLELIRGNKYRPPLSGEIEVDAIIISDYCKGFLEESDIQHICENNDNVFVDTKKKLGNWIKDADYIKINELEYKKNHELLSDDGFKEKLIVTLGSKGCRYKDRVFDVEEVTVKDVSGAGDTFLAGLVRGYLDTNNIESAIEFAQKCTTHVVQKHGVATVTLKELENG
jgi:D-beta-D-heptose 7-phosphate kinase/D-beta-D-heptose 1-phosphate adenosyltransferase